MRPAEVAKKFRMMVYVREDGQIIRRADNHEVGEADHWHKQLWEDLTRFAMRLVAAEGGGNERAALCEGTHVTWLPKMVPAVVVESDAPGFVYRVQLLDDSADGRAKKGQFLRAKQTEVAK